MARNIFNQYLKFNAQSPVKIRLVLRFLYFEKNFSSISKIFFQKAKKIVNFFVSICEGVKYPKFIK